MTSFSRPAVATFVAGSALLTIGVGIAAAAGTATPGAVVTAATDAPPAAVEDFSYPGADKVLADKGIKLFSGNGRIMLAECGAGAGQLEVWPRGMDRICFQVTGKGGYLSLEIPAVYTVKGTSYTTKIDMTVEGEKKSYDIPKDKWVQVGETADPAERDHTLVEIRSTN
ncbi:hypothetical protein ACIRPK_34335 [Kitasatospora sp. NPDC101801]|uniref:hypothetical protein n=1 Tax=Kitasatospora sp. NPDC101801 TaxID=3364103 RepID=UPI003820D814